MIKETALPFLLYILSKNEYTLTISPYSVDAICGVISKGDATVASVAASLGDEDIFCRNLIHELVKSLEKTYYDKV